MSLDELLQEEALEDLKASNALDDEEYAVEADNERLQDHLEEVRRECGEADGPVLYMLPCLDGHGEDCWHVMQSGSGECVKEHLNYEQTHLHIYGCYPVAFDPFLEDDETLP